jgi:hypothetical protein
MGPPHYQRRVAVGSVGREMVARGLGPCCSSTRSWHTGRHTSTMHYLRTEWCSGPKGLGLHSQYRCRKSNLVHPELQHSASPGTGQRKPQGCRCAGGCQRCVPSPAYRLCSPRSSRSRHRATCAYAGTSSFISWAGSDPGARDTQHYSRMSAWRAAPSLTAALGAAPPAAAADDRCRPWPPIVGCPRPGSTRGVGAAAPKPPTAAAASRDISRPRAAVAVASACGRRRRRAAHAAAVGSRARRAPRAAARAARGRRRTGSPAAIL